MAGVLKVKVGGVWQEIGVTGPPVAAGAHHASHEPGGADAIVALDGSVITQGTVARARLPANLVDVSGTPAATEIATFSDADTVQGGSGVILTGGAIPTIGRNTTAGADTGSLYVTGAGVANRARGSYLRLGGNESGDAGNVVIAVGDKAGSKLRVFRIGGIETLNLYGDTGVLSLLEGRLQFPGTQNPSADPTTLDDYREGTWTPTLRGTGGQSGQVYGAQEGSFIKIGRRVSCWGRLQLNTAGTFTGFLQLAGLPFFSTSGVMSVGDVRFSYVWDLATAVVQAWGKVAPNATAADLYANASAVVTSVSMTGAHVKAGTDLTFVVDYIAIN